VTKSALAAKRRQQPDRDRKLQEAHRQWEVGKLTSAFRLFLAVAKTGDESAQLNLGNFYSEGIGVKPNLQRRCIGTGGHTGEGTGVRPAISASFSAIKEG